jgi:tetratricopeptide (TPR) repeat protein
MPKYHLFLSYSRQDNDPEHQGRDGWVTAFHDRLLAQHRRYSGRELKVFFDKASIDHGTDWQRGISEGLRHSVLFIAFLSENYLRSQWCRREWEEYLRLEHTLARGDDGILPIYFEIVPSEMPASRDAQLQQQLAAWIDDIRRRNRGEQFELVPWFSHGPNLLRELDAAERLAELRAHPQSDEHKLLELAARVEAMDRFIAKRLDKAALAALAPGNLDASYSHFVGRHRELRELHATLIADKIGLVGALHGLGGQGKTALAVQYAYAYAEHYVAGGRWFLPCEGKRDMAEALEPLAALIGLALPPPPATLQAAEARDFALKSLLTALEQWTRGNVARIEAQLSKQPELHTLQDTANRPRVEPHCLLILDNVSETDLLSSGGLARLVKEDWLQVIVTTRLDPHQFGGDAATLTPIPVDDLPEPDALALIREFQEGAKFAAAEEEAAAREIVRALGGFTLAIELVAAYLQAHAREGATCAKYLAWLRSKGVVAGDTHGGDQLTAQRVRYGEETPAETEARKRRRTLQVSVIVEDSLQGLSPAARHVLELAALLPPDMIVLDWLQQAAARRYPELRNVGSELAQLRELLSLQGGGAEEDAIRQLLESLDAAKPSDTGSAGITDPWLMVLHELLGRRLLVVTEFNPAQAGRPRQARLHRLVGEHLLARLPAESRAACASALIGVLFEGQARFEHIYVHDTTVLWQLRPLEETVTRLWPEQPHSRELAMAAGVAATAEFETGQLVRAEQLFQRSLEVRERLRAANPESAQAARDVSVSLNKLADFLASRGLPGDAEQALGHYQRSLEVSERLRAANPESAQAARDVSVSHFRLFHFHRQQGNQPEALASLAACFAILDSFAEAGRPMDAAMRQLHAELKPLFTK